jgi:hypothetical protein
MKKYLCFVSLISVCIVQVVYARDDAIAIIGYSGNWGNWGNWQYCPKDSFATGYAMKVEPKLGSGDDTAVNGIKLYCVNKLSGKRVATITSRVAPWGSWREGASCENGALNSSAQSFEPHHDDLDDTATNSVRFKCTSGEAIQSAGSMPWGRWGAYQTCHDKNILEKIKVRTAICGIQTRIEPHQKDGDDTALNGANYACCSYEIIK